MKKKKKKRNAAHFIIAVGWIVLACTYKINFNEAEVETVAEGVQ